MDKILNDSFNTFYDKIFVRITTLDSIKPFTFVGGIALAFS